jgi:hypothetical protein
VSFSLVNHALAQPLPPARRAVLLTLADIANEARICWPSVQTIARRACMSVRSVFNHLAALAKAGLIQRRARIGRASVYTLGPVPTPDTPTNNPAGVPNQLTDAPAGQGMPAHANTAQTPPQPAIAPTTAPGLTMGSVVQAMRTAGLVGAYDCEPLAALVATATSPTEFTEAAIEATRKGKGFAWALARVAGRRKDGRQATGQAPTAHSTAPTQAGRDPVLIQIERDAAQATPPPATIRERLAQLRAAIQQGART